jgi:hypothetical protein
VTFAEVSSSIVVRAEHQFNQHDDERHTLRKHFYELLAPGTLDDPRKITPDEATALICEPISPSDRFGEYLGFLELRPVHTRSPVAMGLLAPPQGLRHDAGVFLILANYGTLFGGPSFPCTVYSTHDKVTGGAHCAQACLIMALGTLADRGARIYGTYTLTYLAKSPFAERIPEISSECLAGQGGMSFVAKGLFPKEMKSALLDCGVSAKIFDSPINPNLESEYAELGFRIIEAYVLARFPVILLVDSGPWWPWEKSGRGIGHAVTVIGIRQGRTRKDSALIVHDPGFIPFYERPFDECVAASRALAGGKAFSCILVADCEIKHHAQDCVARIIESEDSSTFSAFLHGYASYGSSYQIRLLHSDDLPVFLFGKDIYPPNAAVRGQRKELVKWLEAKITRSRYWCVSGLVYGKPRIAWLVDAQNGRNPQISARFNLADDGVTTAVHGPNGWEASTKFDTCIPQSRPA